MRGFGGPDSAVIMRSLGREVELKGVKGGIVASDFAEEWAMEP
jgi:hypothetical protein